MPDIIDITMPTTLRPAVLSRTLESFCRRLFTDRKRYRLIFNVDPVGEVCSPQEVVDTASRYFDNIHYRIADQPSFPVAFRWCWEQAESEFVFHMNEDWTLERPVDVDWMIGVLRKHENLACLKMPKMNIAMTSATTMSAFDCGYRHNPEGFFVAERRNDQFGTNPELLRGSFLKAAREFLVPDLNPEKQFRVTNKPLYDNVVMKWDYAICGNPGDRAWIVDIGRKWMDKHGFRKGTNAPKFVTWEQK